MFINVELTPGVISQMEEEYLWKRTGTIEDENEASSWTEYWLGWGTENAKCVHRSAHIHLKKGLDLTAYQGQLS